MHPATLLLLQLFVVWFARHQEHGFEHDYRPDTRSYLDLAEATRLDEVLSAYRTYGYPLFLRLTGGGEVEVARVPELQFALYSAAILLFWLGLSRYTGSGWLAFAGATPLPYAWIVDFVPQILTDVLAVTVTLVVVSLMLLLATRPGAPLLWAGLTLSVFTAYQIRPSLLFLIVWVPAAAAVLRFCRERQATGLQRWLTGLALTTILPYLLFAGMRLAVVGHFGLVSFGGTNLVGVAACFLDGKVIRELPEEQRSLARAMLSQRQRRGFEPMTLRSDPMVAFRQHNTNLWDVAVQVTSFRLRRERRQLAAEGRAPPDPRPTGVRRNATLSRLAREIIRVRPWLYLRWIRSSVSYGFQTLAGRPWIVWPFVLLACSTPLLVLRRASRRLPGREPSRDRLMLGLFVLGVSYFLAYLSTLSLVSWPVPRYASALVVFLPSVICLQLFEVWRLLLQARPRPAS